MTKDEALQALRKKKYQLRLLVQVQRGDIGMTVKAAGMVDGIKAVPEALGSLATLAGEQILRDIEKARTS